MPYWNFDNTYTILPEIFFSHMHPIPVSNPQLVIYNQPLADSLGTPNELATFAGNHVPNNAAPIAQAYMGHQFGHLTMLGDGRAILLGEQITHSGERYDIQLKGSGRTPYSRGGDGRAALAPMLREYIISEAMHALGIPTTRSLAVVLTGETVQRETRKQGAVLTRVAASHIRVGTFEYAARYGGTDAVRTLASYTMARHFPNAETFLHFLREVVMRQAKLIAKWQLVGFVHGVMNTDNMSISGETIDYGPCAFLDVYNPAAVFSSIDTAGRYSYKNQPHIAVWNLTRFAETLLPLLHNNERNAAEIATAAVNRFWDIYNAEWLDGMRKKTGTYDEDDIKDFLFEMENKGADFTNTFHELNPHSNPTIIPRNFYVDQALVAAEAGDYSVMEQLLCALQDPYAHTPQQEAYTRPPVYKCTTFCGT